MRCLLLALWVLWGAPAPAQAPEPVRVGIAQALPFYGTRVMAAWRAYLEAGLGREVRFVTRPSHNDILNLLVQQKLDFAWICPSHYTRHGESLRLLATPVFQGRPRYQILLLVPAYSTPELESLTDLRGQVVGFAEPDTNFGSRLVFLALRGQGLDPEPFFRRIVYTGDHRKVLEAVSMGLVHGGAVVNQAWETFRRQRPELAGRMRVIWRSRWRPLPPVVAAQGVDRALAEAFRRLLLDMDGDPQGRQILDALHFDRFVATGPGLYTQDPAPGSPSGQAMCPE